MATTASIEKRNPTDEEFKVIRNEHFPQWVKGVDGGVCMVTELYMNPSTPHLCYGISAHGYSEYSSINWFHTYMTPEQFKEWSAYEKVHMEIKRKAIAAKRKVAKENKAAKAAKAAAPITAKSEISAPVKHTAKY